MPTQRTYGWRRDTPDHRDLFRAPRPVGQLPAFVDLRAICPPVYDQGNLGSCTANAIASAVQFDQMKQDESSWMPSRLFIYYCEREMEGTVGEDSGAQIRDGFKAIARRGVCPESLWPYEVDRFATRPTKACYKAALRERAILYERLPSDVLQLKACLAAGFPVVFGFEVFESFESEEVARTGIVPMPKRGERSLGGHAVKLAGYDDARAAGLVKNSWGASWGFGGYCWMPYEFLKRYASDFWTVQKMS